MRAIDRLKLRANEACALRGHDMDAFKPLGRTTAESVCVDCGMGVVINTRPAPNDIDIGGRAVAVNCDHGPITTVEDVFRYFDADYDADKPLKQNNRALSRRVYKDTHCGAWAEIRYTPEFVTTEEVWTAWYTKAAGAWSLMRFTHKGTRIEMADVPSSVHRYFWPEFEDEAMQQFLDEKAKGYSDLTLTESVKVERPTGYDTTVLHMGSIVEGIDATVADELPLPTTKRALREFVQGIEDEVTGLWDSTHGCEACGPEGLYGYREINPDCNVCAGLGEII